MKVRAAPFRVVIFVLKGGGHAHCIEAAGRAAAPCGAAVPLWSLLAWSSGAKASAPGVAAPSPLATSIRCSSLRRWWTGDLALPPPWTRLACCLPCLPLPVQFPKITVDPSALRQGFSGNTWKQWGERPSAWPTPPPLPSAAAPTRRRAPLKQRQALPALPPAACRPHPAGLWGAVCRAGWLPHRPAVCRKGHPPGQLPVRR